jgi:hypothetical protein
MPILDPSPADWNGSVDRYSIQAEARTWAPEDPDRGGREV